MAEGGAARNLRLEYRFDRLFEEKLAQVFQALAPEKLGIIGAVAETIGSPEGGSHYQPDCGTDPVRGDGRIRRTREWVFQDEGYSGASLLRPGLEAIRDLAAEGHIEAVPIHSPDRLSRKYAYRVLLAEEFSKHGVELRFVKSPSVATPEDQLSVQFQGMIAEYERARHVKKSDLTAAYCEVLESEANVVRLAFQTYVQRAAKH